MSIFKKIIDKEIPATIVFEDDRCIAFNDVEPKAPVHILLIPKKEIVSISDLGDTDKDLMGHMMLKVRDIAKDQGLAEGGYRVVCNTGADGGQSVFHLHIHILGGRALSWPPG